MENGGGDEQVRVHDGEMSEVPARKQLKHQLEPEIGLVLVHTQCMLNSHSLID